MANSMLHKFSILPCALLCFSAVAALPREGSIVVDSDSA
jgi:hypothetical protein